ncbi:RAB GTPase protein A3 [Pelomyxa schiedti]|nr:RAB GTPase protein A3 [Pelomyxa schiedti]
MGWCSSGGKKTTTKTTGWFDDINGADAAEPHLRVHRSIPKEKRHITYKVVLLGDPSAGKTSIVTRLTSNAFIPEIPSTIGATYQVHNVAVDGCIVKLEIWDTAGQERYRSLTPMYMRGAHAGVIVYDITSPPSFDSVSRWIEDLVLQQM